MKCPACSGPTTAVQTIPAEKRSDGRVYRYRRCRDALCGSVCTTLEVLHHEVKEEKFLASPTPTTTQAAIPTVVKNPILYDLEGELEKGLPHAVEYIIDAVKPGTTPDKVKLDAAKWLLDDRRRWRIAMAEQSNRAGEDLADPAMAQLAGILRLVGE
jgi:hypothetical protein